MSRVYTEGLLPLLLSAYFMDRCLVAVNPRSFPGQSINAETKPHPRRLIKQFWLSVIQTASRKD